MDDGHARADEHCGHSTLCRLGQEGVEQRPATFHHAALLEVALAAQVGHMEADVAAPERIAERRLGLERPARVAQLLVLAKCRSAAR